MKKDAERIVVKICSSKDLSEDRLEELKAELRNDRYLPSAGETFEINSWEILLVEVEPSEASFSGNGTEIELLDEEPSEEGSRDDSEMDDLDKDASISDFLILELLGDKQRAILEILSKRLDGKDIPVPSLIFLQGPPSTSKTEILKALQKLGECKGWRAKFIDGPSLNRVYVGETAEEIKKLKEDVTDSSILLIDEVDSICGERRTSAGNSKVHLLESVTSLNLLLDKIQEKEAIGVMSSNADSKIIDRAIKNRCLTIRRDKPKKEKVEKFIDILAEDFDLSENDIKEIKRLEPEDFRSAKKIVRLRACGIDLEKAQLFSHVKKEKRHKYIG